MTIDQLARHIHRRGVLAAVATLVVPAKADAQDWQCAEDGEGCTLLIRCCTGECVTLPFNPNAGVCGSGTPDDDDDGDDRDVATCADVARLYGPPGATNLNCSDFECQEDAQDALDDFPNDPCGLDGPPGPNNDTRGRNGVACEDRPRCDAQRVSESRQKARRRRLRLRRRVFR